MVEDYERAPIQTSSLTCRELLGQLLRPAEAPPKPTPAVADAGETAAAAAEAKAMAGPAPSLFERCARKLAAKSPALGVTVSINGWRWG